MNGLIPTVLHFLFGKREQLDEMTERLRTRRLQAQGAFLAGIILPACIILAAMFTDDLAKRANEIFAFVSALMLQAMVVIGYYWKLGSVENKKMIESGTTTAPIDGQ